MIRPFATLFAAPHRLAFLAGSLGLVSAAWWWLVRLGGLYLDWAQPPAGALPAALLHPPVILLQVYPAFIFGFLMTVFPRWMGQPDLTSRQFGPVAAALVIGIALTAGGLWSGQDRLILAGLGLAGIGWSIGLALLGQVVLVHHRAGKSPCWHAVSTLAALLTGLVALSLVVVFMQTLDARLLRWGNALGLGGFILPVFLTVAHRMVPFFAGNVLEDYRRWRPDWLLGALWLLLALRTGADLAGLDLAAGFGALGLAGLTGLMAWRWWPRRAAPGLLWVLILGFTWAPIGFLLAAIGSLGAEIGRAPVHALALGFAGSLLVAMVTRVTQGHSGRPLAMYPLAWLAFASVQAAALLRLAAALQGEPGTLLVLVAAIFAAGLLPWLASNAAIYAAARRDGRPG